LSESYCADVVSGITDNITLLKEGGKSRNRNQENDRSKWLIISLFLLNDKIEKKEIRIEIENQK
jgi:hypothetical protein